MSADICDEPHTHHPEAPNCPREAGHDGEHYTWVQAGRSITVFTWTGQRVYHMSMETADPASLDQVAELVRFCEAVEERTARKAQPPDG